MNDRLEKLIKPLIALGFPLTEVAHAPLAHTRHKEANLLSLQGVRGDFWNSRGFYVVINAQRGYRGRLVGEKYRVDVTRADWAVKLSRWLPYGIAKANQVEQENNTKLAARKNAAERYVEYRNELEKLFGVAIPFNILRDVDGAPCGIEVRLSIRGTPAQVKTKHDAVKALALTFKN